MALFVSYSYTLSSGGFGFGSCTVGDVSRLPTPKEIKPLRDRVIEIFNNGNSGRFTLDKDEPQLSLLNIVLIPEDEDDA